MISRSLVVLLVLACGSPALARIEPAVGEGKDIGQVRSIESVLAELARFGHVRIGPVEICTRLRKGPWKVLILYYGEDGQVDYYILADSLRVELKEDAREVRLHLGHGCVEGQNTMWFDKRTEKMQMPPVWCRGKSPPTRP